MLTAQDYLDARTCLQQGGIVAYPTEGVFGLGVNPFNEEAVLRLVTLKQRAIEQGLILIAHDWPWVQALTLPIPPAQMHLVQSSWPGPVTWVFPASAQAPSWIRGQHPSIALRITAHTEAKQLCHIWGGPLVSTSANRHGCPALTTAQAVIATFGDAVDYVLAGTVGQLNKPTDIRDALTGCMLRGDPV